MLFGSGRKHWDAALAVEEAEAKEEKEKEAGQLIACLARVETIQNATSYLIKDHVFSTNRQ